MNKPKFQLRSLAFELVNILQAGIYRKATKMIYANRRIAASHNVKGWGLCH